MIIAMGFIPGMMLGVEFLWEERTMVLDLLIVRTYIGFPPQED